MSEPANGIMISENIADLDLDKLEDLDEITGNDFAEWLDADGKFIVELLSVKTQDDGAKTPSENLLFKVVAGPHAGKLFLERVYSSAGALQRATGIGYRMGVWTKDQNAAMLETLRAGEPANGPEYSGAVGQRFVIEVKKETTDKGKDVFKMQYMGIWRVDHDSVVNFVAKVMAGGDGADAEPVKGNDKGKATPAKTTTATKGRERTTSGGKAASGAKAGQVATAASVNEL